MFVTDIEDITFWGMNIPKEVEEFTNKTKDGNRENMTDSEFKAYCLGIENTISIMKQLLDLGQEDEITFYYPKTEVTQEFRYDDIVKLMSKKEY